MSDTIFMRELSPAIDRIGCQPLNCDTFPQLISLECLSVWYGSVTAIYICHLLISFQYDCGRVRIGFRIPSYNVVFGSKIDLFERLSCV